MCFHEHCFWYKKIKFLVPVSYRLKWKVEKNYLNKSDFKISLEFHFPKTCAYKIKHFQAFFYNSCQIWYFYIIFFSDVDPFTGFL